MTISTVTELQLSHDWLVWLPDSGEGEGERGPFHPDSTRQLGRGITGMWTWESPGNRTNTWEHHLGAIIHLYYI